MSSTSSSSDRWPPIRPAETLRSECCGSFEDRHVTELAEVHRRINVPVRLVWGAVDKFFPLAAAEAMVNTFADASLAVIPDAGLFSHEERPAEVAAALLPVLTSPS